MDPTIRQQTLDAQKAEQPLSTEINVYDQFK
jgi:hypothetical protein